MRRTEAGAAVGRIELTVGTRLDLDAERRAAVDRAFAARRAANPGLWNGPFFLFEDVALAGDHFTATARPTDYATFLDWRGRGFPGEIHTHIFPVPAVTTSDDRLLVGVMGAATANAGLAYPPSGSFDDADVVAGRLDPVANMGRELSEEAGIDIAGLRPDPGFVVLSSGPRRLALVKRWRSPLGAAELASAIADHLGRERDPELAGFDFVAFERRLAPARTVGYVNTLLGLLEASARSGGSGGIAGAAAALSSGSESVPETAGEPS